jgi:parvulin-like peptidyl-prolyl isomerase
MIYRGVVCLLLGALAWGQAANPTSSQPPAPSQNPAAPSNPVPAKPATDAKPAPEASNIPPDGAVITIQGLCDNPPADKTKASDCKTVITRAEFEKLVDALGPNMAPPARRQVASRYAMGLVMAHEAHKMRLDQGPRYEELLRIARVQVATQQLGHALQEKASQISDKDIEDYYRSNSAAYDEVSLDRIFVPKNKEMPTPATKVKLSEAETKKRQADGEAAMKTEAEALRKRAAAGEPFSKLQDEAFQFAGLKSKPPSPSMGKVRRSNLPPSHAAVMELKPGAVSALISDPSGFFIYKVGQKETVPLDTVKEEIRGTLRAQRMQDAMQTIQQSATPELNEKYFGATPGSPLVPGGVHSQSPSDPD